MFWNYFKITLRRLLKDRFYSAINILGLAIGIACFMYILIYVKDELSYDAYHEKADRIYRIDFRGKLGETEAYVPEVGAITGQILQQELPEIETFTRIREPGDYLVRYEDQTYRESNIYFADSTLLDVFSFHLIEGKKDHVLDGPGKVLITESTAEKYFGGVREASGKVLVFDNEERFTVSGVIEDIPAQTHFHCDFFLAMASREESRQATWTNMNFHTYFVLKPGADPAAMEAKFPALIRKYVGAEVEKFMNISYDDLLNAGNYFEYHLTPLRRIHLYAHTMDDLQPNGDIKYVYIFSFIGFFILLIACINFMNLATARSARRAREVGIRKVVGALKKQLVVQFLGESLIITFLSVLIALALIQLLLPQFNGLSGKAFTSRDLQAGWVWLASFAIMVVVGFLSGSYPAFFLSGFRPLRVLKGSFTSREGGKGFRNGLVVFQFIITSILIVGTLIISDQMRYIQNKKLGFSKEQVLIIQNAYSLENKLLPFKQTMEQDPQVISASVTSYLPIPSARNTSSYFRGRSVEQNNSQIVQNWYVDEDFLPTLGIQLAKGRNFDPSRGTDSAAVIINEAAEKVFGFDDALGQELSRFRQGLTNEGNELIPFQIIGVVENFHFQSLRDKIAPMVIHLGNSQSFVALKVKSTDMQPLIQRIEQKWTTMAPGQPFEYTFLDEGFNSMYDAEVRVGNILGTFAILAILIACMGLLGLATFTAEQKTKEIAVRKVLGASISQLFLLLTSEFTKWVLVANLVALPIAYWVMREWLSGFAYQTSIGVGSLVIALMAGIVIALITVSYQSFRASRANPVRSLKYE